MEDSNIAEFQSWFIIRILKSKLTELGVRSRVTGQILTDQKVYFQAQIVELWAPAKVPETCMCFEQTHLSNMIHSKHLTLL